MHTDNSRADNGKSCYGLPLTLLYFRQSPILFGHVTYAQVMNIVIVPHNMARFSTPGRLDAVLRGSNSTNSEDPSSGDTIFPLRFARKFKKVSTFYVHGYV